MKNEKKKTFKFNLIILSRSFIVKNIAIAIKLQLHASVVKPIELKHNFSFHIVVVGVKLYCVILTVYTYLHCVH